MSKWIDEHPDRYAQIKLGDYMPMGVEGKIHFVKCIKPFTIPEDFTACGIRMPDWRKHPTAHPICGVVNCHDCLDAMEKDINEDS